MGTLVSWRMTFSNPWITSQWQWICCCVLLALLTVSWFVVRVTALTEFFVGEFWRGSGFSVLGLGTKKWRDFSAFGCKMEINPSYMSLNVEPICISSSTNRKPGSNVAKLIQKITIQLEIFKLKSFKSMKVETTKSVMLQIRVVLFSIY